MEIEAVFEWAKDGKLVPFIRVTFIDKDKIQIRKFDESEMGTNYAIGKG